MKENESREDYLERILMLEEKQGFVRAIDIANSLGYSKPSVSIAIKKLKADDLIIIEDRTNYIKLTKKGNEIAQMVYERHKVISSLLKYLGVSEDTALDDACKIEHDLSSETFEKIKEAYKKIC